MTPLRRNYGLFCFLLGCIPGDPQGGRNESAADLFFGRSQFSSRIHSCSLSTLLMASRRLYLRYYAHLRRLFKVFHKIHRIFFVLKIIKNLHKQGSAFS